MSHKTKRRLSRFADALEAVVNLSIRAIAGTIELCLIDLAFGKSRYRKRYPKMRPIIHKTYNRTYVVRERLTYPEHVYTVKAKQEQ